MNDNARTQRPDGLHDCFVRARQLPFKAHRFTHSDAIKDLRFLKTMASAAKISFASAMAQGGVGPKGYVPHQVGFFAWANGAM